MNGVKKWRRDLAKTLHLLKIGKEEPGPLTTLSHSPWSRSAGCQVLSSLTPLHQRTFAC